MIKDTNLVKVKTINQKILDQVESKSIEHYRPSAVVGRVKYWLLFQDHIGNVWKIRQDDLLESLRQQMLKDETEETRKVYADEVAAIGKLPQIFLI